MSDGLKPVSGERRSQFCSWSATLVDSLDTLWIMGLHEEFDQAVNATLAINFAYNADNCTVNLFESTIRYLGGLLAAYDLSQQRRLIPKLIEVGDMLYGAFNTTNGMPCSHCHLASKTEDDVFMPSAGASMADVGTLYLEFGRLSQITGDSKYHNAIDNVAMVFSEAQLNSTIPGLWPEFIDTRLLDTGRGKYDNFVSASYTYSLGANSDSSYEYLLKAHMLMGRLTSVYANMWTAAASAIRETLLFKAFIPGTSHRDLLFSGLATRYPGVEDIQLEPRTQHLACFAGGLFAIASKIFDSPEDFEIGRRLTDGCVWAYQNAPTGIMPETFTTIPCPDLDTHQCEWNQTEWDVRVPHVPCEAAYCSGMNLPPGFLSVRDARYILRPEAIESVFILWRMSGDEYWRDVGWEMFQSIIRHTRSAFGHSALTSVMVMQPTRVLDGGVFVTRNRAVQSDDMESFWFAETLKYFYLLFSDVELISLDEYVLNTEAHPLRLNEGFRGF